ncbi:2-oxoglutarate dehydrogenase, partial [Mesorhizobium sp. M8A.F.Ca.ET.181.01.1.1]
PLVAARDGWQVTYRGTVYIERRNGSLAEHVIQFDARPENDKTET